MEVSGMSSGACNTKMDAQEEVTFCGKIPGKIDGSLVTTLTTFINDLGGQVSVEKKISFDDLGLAELEKGVFQCLACSKIIKRKDHAIRHFKQQHLSEVDSKIQINCPRCNEELPKTKLNSHMEQKHDVKKFDQLLKRSQI